MFTEVIIYNISSIKESRLPSTASKYWIVHVYTPTPEDKVFIQLYLPKNIFKNH